jgi:hypothetical protein
MQASTITISISLIVLVFLYLVFFRPWQLRWGATDAEVKRSLPGDEIVDKPSFNATRAVTIHAPAQNIYPWIVQMGVSRAGWYSYDLLDNLGRRSAESLLPEHQNIQIGDLIPVSRDGKQGTWVKYLRKDKWVLWWDKNGATSWVWEIHPEEEGSARLITRVRVKYKLFSTAILFNLLIEIFDVLMMRRSMFGIKRRAEKPL